MSASRVDVIFGGWPGRLAGQQKPGDYGYAHRLDGGFTESTLWNCSCGIASEALNSAPAIMARDLPRGISKSHENHFEIHKFGRKKDKACENRNGSK
jgi:hypothetical protein